MSLQLLALPRQPPWQGLTRERTRKGALGFSPQWTMTLENTIWLSCVSSDTHSPGRDTSKRAVSCDISHCYSFGRAFRFKVIGRLIPPEAACGTWGLLSDGCLGKGLAEGDPGPQRGQDPAPCSRRASPAGRAGQQSVLALPALHFLPCRLTLPTQNRQCARYPIRGVSNCAQLDLGPRNLSFGHRSVFSLRRRGDWL